MMNTKHIWQRPRRIAAALVMEILLCQAVMPAFATVSQVPGIYIEPPRPNVMYTLDDSGSMTSDAIPDFIPCYKDSSGNYMPDSSSLDDTSGCGTKNQSGSNGSKLPSMWKSGSGYLNPKYYSSDNLFARYMRSSAGNPLYYDREVTYKPWPKASDDNTLNDPAVVTKVNVHVTDPFNTGYRFDLTTRLPTTSTGSDDEKSNFWPATYYVYDTSKGAMPDHTPDNSLNVVGNFTKVEIKSTVKTYKRGSKRSDCSGAIGPDGCTYNEELQNFANWLQYYRSRMLMAKGGVAAAFAQQGTNLRVGFATINKGIQQGVATFSTTTRTAFYTNLYAVGNNGSTPLRLAMDTVGKYYQGKSLFGNPWAEDTTSTPATTDSCRRSFHIMSTDGFWNGSDASAPANTNNDTFTGATTPAQPDGTVYSYSDTGAAGTLADRFTINPYNDNNANNKNTLADVAAYYWRTDLQGTVENRIPPSTRDPAYWQHVTTFTVGLGITGTGKVQPKTTVLASGTNSAGDFIVPTTTLSSSPYYDYKGQPWLSSQGLRDLLVKNKVPLVWTTPSSDAEETGDDLIHASINGHGRYFSATNPTELSTGLASALAEATNQPQSTANLVTTTAQVSSNNHVYQATYNPYGWAGRVYSFALNNDNDIDTSPSKAEWEVSKAMPAPSSRNIYTWNSDSGAKTGSAFTWAGLNSTQKGFLNNDSTLLDYLRGSIEKEAQNNGPFRDRVRETLAGGALGGVLGDIVGGSPVKGPDDGGGYQRMSAGTPGQDSYQVFRSTDSANLSAMRNTLFFGANDGMLHAIDISNGQERFAYVPDSVFNVPRTRYEGSIQTVQKLRKLADPAYSHLFTVNGPPQIADAYIGPTAATASWKNVLVSSTGAGARSVFGIDVSNPVVGSATAPFNAGKILWEFSAEDTSNANRANMGHVISYPHVARMRDGTWVAMFGNGYDSSTGQASLYLLDLQTGAVIWERTVGAAGGNGLSQPNFVLNSNREVTAIYAGDLKGNLWKFDVDSTARTDWKVALGGVPLFAAGDKQPITVMPEISFNTSAGGAVISFGTGKFFELEDTASTGNVNLNMQAIYGIWDKPGETTGVSGLGSLVQQAYTGASATGFTGTTQNPIDWATKRGWYLNLTTSGERVNINPQQQGKVLIVVANTPSNEVCSSGGKAKIILLDPLTGAAPSFAVFDATRDGSINSDDKAFNVRRVDVGILSLPRILTGSGGTAVVGGTSPESVASRGQTGANQGGVEANKTVPCQNGGTGTMVIGVSDASADVEKVKVCDSKGRVTWRQLK